MKLNETQAAAIERFGEAYRRYKRAQAEEHAIARQQAEARILAFKIEAQKEAARAEAVGASYSKIAKQGMNVQNGTTAKNDWVIPGRTFLAQDQPAAPAAEPEVQRYEFDVERSRLVVTFQPEDFAGKIPDITAPQTLAFLVDGEQLTPEGEDYIHPVARLALTPDGRREIAAYLASIND